MPLDSRPARFGNAGLEGEKNKSSCLISITRDYTGRRFTINVMKLQILFKALTNWSQIEV